LAGAERIAVVSNAEAALRAAADPTAAAIASKTAATLYKVPLLARDIQDESRNTTRFLVLSRETVNPSGYDKTSLIVSTRNVPGAIYELLAPLALNKVSLTRLESRPAKTGLWEYVFYVDIEGHDSDPAVAQALKEIEGKATFMKNRGYWNTFWEDLVALSPDFFEAYLNLSSIPWTKGVLAPKVKEFIYIAVDVATTHLYEPGLRIHIANALKHGATVHEIVEVYQLTSTLGLHTFAVGMPVLLDELKNLRRSRP
jgi:alkylhydroperoxidase/carboxymuconolactone decarboxylase family protein YurZ